MRAKRAFKKPAKHGFCFCGVSREIFDNVTLVARQKKNFRGFSAIFFVTEVPPKEAF